MDYPLRYVANATNQPRFPALFLHVKLWRATFLALMLAATGCATSTIESRKTEQPAAYAQLSPEEKMMVDQGQIRIGMSKEAVYIAWGPPSETLESEAPESGRITTWIYHGQWMEETRFWTYREVSRDGRAFLERYLETDYNAREYIRAEIQFRNGLVARWRTLPRPLP